MKAALYARVSTEEQVEGYSIDAQLRACRSYANQKGWTIVSEYVDEGKSARTKDIAKRPRFQQMLQAASNREFEVLVVHKLDRFSRNLMVTLRSLEELQRFNVSFISINEQIDFTTPIGKVLLATIGAFAQFYSDNLSQETKKGWSERRSQGLYCGTLPFGAMKDDDGIPMPDMQPRGTKYNGHEVVVCNYEGLRMAFDLAAQGKSDREIAVTLNASGYKTTGTHGPRPFSRSTVKDMLVNKFYAGYIPDGNGGWLEAQHEPFVDRDLFESVQEVRSMTKLPRQTINSDARTYSLSCISRCAQCGGNIRMQTNLKGRARVYCSTRAEGSGCNFSGTFLDVYEKQIEWYLENFIIPEDYQKKILDAHRRLRKAYSDNGFEREQLEASLERLRQQFRWGHISQQDYMKQYGEIEYQIQQLTPEKTNGDELKRLAHFLGNVADAWREANQNQRNKLARVLFDEIRLDSGGKVVAVKPRLELEPFFKLSYDCHARDIGCDPGGLRGLGFKLFQPLLV